MSAYLILLASPMIALVAIAVFQMSYRTSFGRVGPRPQDTPAQAMPFSRVDTDASFIVANSLDGEPEQREESCPMSSPPASTPAEPMKHEGAAPAQWSGARLVDLSGTYKRHSFPIPAAGVTIGRSPYVAEVVLGNPRISSSHAWIGLVDGRPILRDLNSTNGTYLNGHVVSPGTEAELCSGDTIVFACLRGERFRFEVM